MKKIILAVTTFVTVEVADDFDTQTAIGEFASETDYEFSNTDNVRVVDTEIREVEEV